MLEVQWSRECVMLQKFLATGPIISYVLVDANKFAPRRNTQADDNVCTTMAIEASS